MIFPRLPRFAPILIFALLAAAPAFSFPGLPASSQYMLPAPGDADVQGPALSVPRSGELADEEAFMIARKLVLDGDLENAGAMLEAIGPMENPEYDKDRRFLLGQLALARSDYGAAIGYFRGLLNDDPDMTRVRLDLALAYMRAGSYYKADYHLRLAMGGEGLPPEVRENAARLLFQIRQNRNWNVWMNFGVAPDNNVNSAVGGEQCIIIMGYLLCNQLPEKERDVGLSFGFGGMYEIRLGERWRIKSDAGFHSTRYENKAYDDMYLYASAGPRYVYPGGDVWLALSASRRYVGHAPYDYSVGFKMDASRDLGDRLSMTLGLKYMPSRHDEAKALDGETHGANVSFSYTLSSSSYAVFKAGLEKENDAVETYSNRRTNFAVGYGTELGAGFSVYLEPSVMFTDYDGETSHVLDYWFHDVRRRDKTWRYAIMLLNRKIDIYGFSPTLTYSYTDRHSNVWQSEFAKSTFELSATQRF